MKVCPTSVIPSKYDIFGMSCNVVDGGMPSFDLGLDLEALLIVLKNSRSSSCDPNFDSDIFD